MSVFSEVLSLTSKIEKLNKLVLFIGYAVLLMFPGLRQVLVCWMLSVNHGPAVTKLWSLGKLRRNHDQRK